MNSPGILTRVRADILAMKGYASARSLINPAEDLIQLDANELPVSPLIGTEGYNHYAPQQPVALVTALADLYGVPVQSTLVTRGADEAIDVLTRLFCNPGSDSIVVCPPTFPMYGMAARLNGSAIIMAPLTACFDLDIEKVLAAIRDDTKLVYICSPNNPTGNSVSLEDIVRLCDASKDKALVVVDEAYIDFSGNPSAVSLLPRFDNLAVLRTLSKSMALAGVRCGTLLAHEDVIAQARKVLAPYPLPVPVIETVLKTLKPANRVRLETAQAETLAIKRWFTERLAMVPGIEKVFPSDANFVLVQARDAAALYEMCLKNSIAVRNASHQPGLASCLRFSIGTRKQMETLLCVLETGEKPARLQGRVARTVRRTNETAIEASIDLDTATPVNVETGIGFFDHMLEQIARHGGFSLKLEALGDLNVDEHHTVEDCGIVLGQVLRQALGDKAGIERYGFTLPMDEALASVALDLSGRHYFKFEGVFPDQQTETISPAMVEHFFRSLAENLPATLHIKIEGKNVHHMVEACFKAFGRALRQAIRRTGIDCPSTKGTL